MSKLIQDLKDISSRMRSLRDNISANRVDQGVAYIEALEKRIVRINLNGAKKANELREKAKELQESL